jgi:hypothetical protein
MKKMFALGLGLIVSLKPSLGAMMYSGNGDTTGGGAVGTGSLTLTDNGTTLFGTFTRGGGTFTEVLVIFIDSKSGGFQDTHTFTDDSTALRRGVSGYQGGNRSNAIFVNGFLADYAIALRPFSISGADGYDRLFQLGSGTFTSLGGVNLAPVASTSSSTYTFSIALSDIGVAPGGSFRIETDLVRADGQQHYLESFETFDLDPDKSDMSNMVTFNSSHTYVTAVPEMTNGALAVFGGIFLACGALTHAARAKKAKRDGDRNARKQLN